MAYVIEGLREKILSRSEEFKGKRVRLVVLNEINAGFDSPGQNKLYPLDTIVGMGCSSHGSLSEEHARALYHRR